MTLRAVTPARDLRQAQNAIVRGALKSLKTAYATIKGFEVMRALKKGQAQLWQYGGGIMGEVRLIERQFGIYTA